MLQLAYHSVSSFRDGSPNLYYDLAVLIDACLHNNSALGITGALALRDGHFIQVLEGPGATVAAMFDRICVDYRHAGVRELGRDTCTLRSFPGWAMAYFGPEYDLNDVFALANTHPRLPHIAPLAGRMAQMLG